MAVFNFNKKQREHEKDMQRNAQTFAASEANLQRVWSTAERKDTQGWQSGEGVKERSWRTSEREGGEKFIASEGERDRSWRDEQRKRSSADRIAEAKAFADIPIQQKIKMARGRFEGMGMTPEQMDKAAELYVGQLTMAGDEAAAAEATNRKEAALATRPYIKRRTTAANMRGLAEDEAATLGAGRDAETARGAIPFAGALAELQAKAAAAQFAADAEFAGSMRQKQLELMDAQIKGTGYFDRDTAADKIAAYQELLNKGKQAQPQREKRMTLRDLLMGSPSTNAPAAESPAQAPATNAPAARRSTAETTNALPGEVFQPNLRGNARMSGVLRKLSTAAKQTPPAVDDEQTLKSLALSKLVPDADELGRLLARTNRYYGDISAP